MKRKADYEEKCILVEEANNRRLLEADAKLKVTPVQRRKKHSSEKLTPVVLRKVRQCLAPNPEVHPHKRSHISDDGLSTPRKRPTAEEKRSWSIAKTRRLNHGSSEPSIECSEFDSLTYDQDDDWPPPKRQREPD